MEILKGFFTVFLALVAFSSVEPSEENFELLILHNNDMHAKFEQVSQYIGACTAADSEAGKCYGGFPRIAHVVKEARKKAQTGEGPPVLYLNAGDTYTGTAWFTIYKWKIAAEFVNALQSDAVSLGNHELDRGVAGLTPFIKNLTCPVLAANLNLTKVPELQSESNLVKSVVLNVNGTKIGIIGYLTPATKILGRKHDVEFFDEIPEIEKEAVKLKSQGVNILIALGHSGYFKDLEIAKEIKDIDLVIGGHSHTFLWTGIKPDVEDPKGPYPTMVTQDSGKIVPTVQAYADTKYLGKINIVFNSCGDLIHVNGKPLLLDSSIPQDPDVLGMVEDYRKKVHQFTERIIGKTAVALDGHSCRIKECNMGNLVTDSVIYKYNLEFRTNNSSKNPIAVVNGGSIRTSIKHEALPANITQGDLLQVLPFPDQIIKISFNGSMIKTMLEHSVFKYNPLEADGRLFQISGAKVTFDFEKQPGERVESIYVKYSESDVEYSVLDMSKMYDVLVSDFIAMGGDGYSFLSHLPFTSLGYITMESALQYIAEHIPVSPTVEGRLTMKNVDKYNKIHS